MTLYEDLVWRGLVQEISSPELIDKLNKKITEEQFERVKVKLENELNIKQKKYNAQNEMDANMKINDAQKWLEKRRKIEYEERM